MEIVTLILTILFGGIVGFLILCTLLFAPGFLGKLIFKNVEESKLANLISLTITLIYFSKTDFNKFAEPFSEGLAAVRDKGWGYINTQGKYVIKPQFEVANNFSHGLASAAYRAGHNQAGQYGFIDKTGKTAVSARYMDVRDFSEGLAQVQFYR